MKVFSTAFFILVTLFGLVPASTAQEGVRAQTSFVEDEVLVKFIPGTAASEIAAAHQAAGGVVVRRVVALDVQVVKVSAGQAVQRLPLYQRNRNVQYAELNIIYRIADDPFFPAQWSLNNTGQLGGTADADIDAPEAWATSTGSGVKIAVVDTGIKKTHPEIGAAKVIAEIDYSTDGTVDDLHGHGTHVGSTAAGNSSNGLGIHGVAAAAQLLNAKVLNSAGSGTCDSVANGITWAADNGAHVINLSLGGGACTTEENAVNYAWSLGKVLACAAGNNGNSGLFYPAAYPNCISVGATDRNDQKASFSNFGSTVDVGAPGVAIAAALPGSSAEVTTSGFGLLTVTGAGVSQLEREAIPLEYSETTLAAALQAQAVYAGLGAESDFAAVDCTGKIAVIERGTYTFAAKVTNAKNDGCVGAVIYNNVAGDRNFTLGSAGEWLPVVSLSQADGQDLVSRIGAGLTTLRLAVRNDYARWNGTSMATPHVSGTAALLWATCWGTSNSSVRDRLQSTADPVGLSYWTHGRINAASAVSGCVAPLPDTTPPLPPTNVAALDAPGDQGGAINVTWTPSVSGDVTQQRIYRGTATGVYGATPIATLAGNASTSFTDSGRTNVTTYYYVVRAFDGTNESANSNEASATAVDNLAPAAPSDLAATPGDQQVVLAWTPSASGDVTQQRIYRGTATGVYGAPIATLAGNASTSFTDSGRTNVTTYYYVVRAFDGTNESANSNEASATPQAAPPPLVSCAAPSITSTADTKPSGSGTVSFTWDPVPGATEYKVERRNSDGTWSTRQTSSATSFTGADHRSDPSWRVFVSAGSCSPLPGPATVFDP